MRPSLSNQLDESTLYKIFRLSDIFKKMVYVLSFMTSKKDQQFRCQGDHTSHVITVDFDMDHSKYNFTIQLPSNKSQTIATMIARKDPMVYVATKGRKTCIIDAFNVLPKYEDYKSCIFQFMEKKMIGKHLKCRSIQSDVNFADIPFWERMKFQAWDDSDFDQVKRQQSGKTRMEKTLW